MSYTWVPALRRRRRKDNKPFIVFPNRRIHFEELLCLCLYGYWFRQVPPAIYFPNYYQPLSLPYCHKAIIETIKSKRVGVITAQHITAEVERRMIQTQLPQQSSG